MAVNGFQLSKGKSLDTGSRTKSPDDNRDAMQKHADVRSDALYGALDKFNDSPSITIGGGPIERQVVEEDAQVIEMFNYTFPRREQIIKRSGPIPKFFKNIKLGDADIEPSINKRTDVTLNRLDRISKFNENV